MQTYVNWVIIVAMSQLDSRGPVFVSTYTCSCTAVHPAEHSIQCRETYLCYLAPPAHIYL
jgi:hypothetical protein